MDQFENAEYYIAFPKDEKIIKRIRDRNLFRKLNKINYIFVDENKELFILKFNDEEILKTNVL